MATAHYTKQQAAQSAPEKPCETGKNAEKMTSTQTHMVHDVAPSTHHIPEVKPRRVRVADWRDLAACATEKPVADNDFDHTSGPAQVRALATCTDCPVMAQCHAWAEADTDFVGVAGGATWSTYRRRKNKAKNQVTTV